MQIVIKELGNKNVKRTEKTVGNIVRAEWFNSFQVFVLSDGTSRTFQLCI